MLENILDDPDIDTEPNIRRVEFHRIESGSYYADKTCPECANPHAEFEYALWYDDKDAPSETGAMCGVCAAAMLLQESGIEAVVLEKSGLSVTASL